MRFFLSSFGGARWLIAPYCPGAAPAADLEGLPKALSPTPADVALAELRAAIAAARLGTVIGVALVEVWSTSDARRIGGDGTPMLLVHEVGPGASRESALFHVTPQGVAAAGAWVRSNLPSES